MRITGYSGVAIFVSDYALNRKQFIERQEYGEFGLAGAM